MTQTPTDALRLVPVEPTREQQLAMQSALLKNYPDVFEGEAYVNGNMLGAIYSAALAAAPASPLPLPTESDPILSSTDLADSGASPLPEGGGWRTDFENVPKDGSVFLIAYDDEAARKGRLYDNSERVYEARWNEVGETWSARNGFIRHPAATHWMPLPAAPTGDA